MRKSLLGHLYNHIKGSAEDVATMSLQYLLSYYDELQHSFNTLIEKRLGIPVDKNITYECQSVGDELERPDMSGTDSNGKEVILCEVKFYAGLTSNQPLTYLRRLKDENGAGIVFICPKDRVESLWDTLMNKCKGESVELLERACADVSGVRLTILSWEEIIEDLTRTANAFEKSSLADIEQLSGYCEQIINESFVPFKAEELGAYEAKKYERLMYILDRVVDSILADKDYEADIKKLKATAFRDGYTRYFRLNGFCVTLQLNLLYWSDDRYMDTPFWISFNDDTWKTPGEYIDRFTSVIPSRKVVSRDSVFLALDVPCGVMEDAVIESIKKQISEYLSLLM